MRLRRGPRRLQRQTRARSLPRACGGAGQPGEPVELEGVFGDAEGARPARVEFVVSDDQARLKAIAEVPSGAFWQRCYVHFLRNALDYVPRKVDDDCLIELRWMYDRRDLTEARRDLAQWLGKWSGKYARLTGWVEENIKETLSYFRLPLAHRKHIKSTNMLERLNEEISRRRRTYVVRIFPNGESCLRLVRVLTVERHESLARRPPLSQHGSVEGAQEGDAASSGLTRLKAHQGDGFTGPHDRSC